MAEAMDQLKYDSLSLSVAVHVYTINVYIYVSIVSFVFFCFFFSEDLFSFLFWSLSYQSILCVLLCLSLIAFISLLRLL